MSDRTLIHCALVERLGETEARRIRCGPAIPPGVDFEFAPDVERVIETVAADAAICDECIDRDACIVTEVADG